MKTHNTNAIQIFLSIIFYSPIFNILFKGQSITKTILLIHAVIIFTASLSYAQQETNGCNTNCSAEWNNQICATNDEGKTELFPNECVMKSKNCLNKSSKLNNIIWILRKKIIQAFFFRICENWSSWRWLLPVKLFIQKSHVKRRLDKRW